MTHNDRNDSEQIKTEVSTNFRKLHEAMSGLLAICHYPNGVKPPNIDCRKCSFELVRNKNGVTRAKRTRS